MNILTVSQINFYVKSIIDADNKLANFYLSGEISNFKGHYKSGHLYFSLKDSKSVVRCVMFSSFSNKLRFKPADGLKVLVRGNLSVYEATGQYQIYVEDMQTFGVGELSSAFDQLRFNLAKEGLFDLKHKQKLPKYPNKIGVISSPVGAAVKDVQDTINRRFPLAKLMLYPVLVQGDDAAFQITNAIKVFSKKKLVDVIIIARGGGSAEELWAFNNEELARTIYNCDIPVVSGVGHQTDFTICDFVSDLRAPTPTAAAEMCTPDYREIFMEIKSLLDRANSAVRFKVNEKLSEINTLEYKLEKLSPQIKISNNKMLLNMLCEKLNDTLSSKILSKEHELQSCIYKLELLNPLVILKRGYLVAKDDKDNKIKSISSVNTGENIKVVMSDGFIECKVISKGEI